MSESPIVPGIVAFIKTTAEPVFILDVVPQETSVFPSIDPTLVTVRRGIVSKDGISYTQENFFRCELMTSSEMNHQIAADYHEKESIVNEFQQARPVKVEATPVN